MINLGIELCDDGIRGTSLSLEQVVSKELMARLKFRKLGLWHRLFMRACLKTLPGSRIYHKGNCDFEFFNGRCARCAIFPTLDDPMPGRRVATSLYLFTLWNRVYMILGQVLTLNEISAASIAKDIRKSCIEQLGMQTHRDERFDAWEDDESTVLLEISKNLKNVLIYWRLK